MAKIKLETSYLYAARYLDADSCKRFILAIIDIVEGAPPNTEGIEAVIAPVAAAINAELEHDRAISQIRREAAMGKKAAPDQAKPKPAPEEIDLGVYSDELKRYFDYLRERKLPTYKPTALKALLKRVERECMGNTAILKAAIDETIERNYQGLFFHAKTRQNNLQKQIPTNYADF